MGNELRRAEAEATLLLAAMATERRAGAELGLQLEVAHGQLLRLEGQRAKAWEHNDFLRTHLRQRARGRSAAGGALSPARAEDGWGSAPPDDADDDLAAYAVAPAFSASPFSPATSPARGAASRSPPARNRGSWPPVASGKKDVMLLDSAGRDPSPFGPVRASEAAWPDGGAWLADERDDAGVHLPTPRTLAAPPLGWPASPYAMHTPSHTPSSSPLRSSAVSSLASGLGGGGGGAPSGTSRLPPPSARMLKVAQERLASHGRTLAAGATSA
ncbi:hypothetical protein T492DRAFT_880354 [Pavlovales sp. CCMP2436]|nr:hypothetical protein T492DRAFT_880354 [Pavlovales sp. CCMP2436]